MTTSARRVLAAAACAGALTCSGPVASATAAPAPPPAITVKPAHKLVDGEKIVVSWTGVHWRQDDSIELVQCNNDGGGLDGGCAGAVTVSPPTRHGSVEFTVHTGAIGRTGACGTSDRDKRCTVDLVGFWHGGLIREDAGALIAFAVP